MTTIVTETFFLPDEVKRESWSVPAVIYNLYHAIHTRSQMRHVFVPIRSMQYMAVLDHNEIVFVDGQSYAVSNNEGGRLIVVAWKFSASHQRDALTDPVPCEVVFYIDDNADLQLRLVAEFRAALELYDKRYRSAHMPASGAKILKLQ